MKPLCWIVVSLSLSATALAGPDPAFDARCHEGPQGYQPISTVDHFNIMDFGAVCDGINDDSHAIAAANETASLNKKGIYNAAVVYPANKTCIVSDVQLLADQIGDNTTLRLPDGANKYMFNIATENMWITGFIFDGNRYNQADPLFTQTFDGVAENSLIHAKSLFENILIEHNTFRDTAHGALALALKDPINTPAWQISTAVIRNNHFENIQTEAMRVFNPYRFMTVSNNEIHMNGTFVLTDNTFVDVGTTNRLEYGNTEHGNTVLTGGFSCFYGRRNFFDNSARFNLKFGGINDFLIADNQSINAHWGALQLRTFRYDTQATVLPGKILVFDNHYESSNMGSIFMQLGGTSSIAEDQGHKLVSSHREVWVSGNHIAFDNGGRYNAGADAITMSSLGHYENLVVENNTFINARRSAVRLHLPYRQGFRMHEVTLINNLVLGDNLTTNSGLLGIISTHVDRPEGWFHSQPVFEVNVVQNHVERTNLGFFTEGDALENLFADGNFYSDLYQPWDVKFMSGSHSSPNLNSAYFAYNDFDGNLGICGYGAVNSFTWVNNSIGTMPTQYSSCP